MNTASLLVLRLRQQIADLFSHAVADEEGADMAEYALVLVLIAVVAILAVTVVGTQVQTAFCNVATGLGGSC
jgi:Flp pilus assembly pilin Flp